MASSLEDDLSCPVCCELYQDPQLLLCGHSFCRLCLDKPWATGPARTCPVCRRASPQKPVANLVLRNTCETYLREKEREKECDGEVRCSQHGEKMSLFCKTDEKVICSECRRSSHSSHRVQPLIHAVHQRKRQVKAALRPAEKALESLRHDSSRHSKLKGKIQDQVQQTERLIRKDFETFRQFLNEEEENRVAALKLEEQEKTAKVDKSVEQQVESLWDRVRDVEDELENDNVTFLQNFDSVLLRARNAAPGSELDPGALIDVAKHLGNLKYKVWEKMKDICPHYPIVLDPNTTPAGFSISENLAELRKSTQDSSPVPHHRNRIVLGSEGYTNGFHCWDVEVGDNKHWTIGVCRGTAMRNPLPDISPGNGFWGLRREGDSCHYLYSTNSRTWWNIIPRTVRVKLGQNLRQRTVSFYYASTGIMIGSIKVPDDEKLFPFLIPGEHLSAMRIPPDHVTPTVREKFNLIRSPPRLLHGLLAGG
ncbi:nuclear factor 7, brain-like isoform X2 [Salminus brasiliensis]|uniref:nuclear factor 7, brain-like isoform X2 n=1 Tax=Salminus brasiliensis TaxID=930266 RepID=UPI003B82D65B